MRSSRPLNRRLLAAVATVAALGAASGAFAQAVLAPQQPPVAAPPPPVAAPAPPRPITVAVSSVGASSRVVRRRVPAWRVPKVDPRLRRRRPDPMGAR